MVKFLVFKTQVNSKLCSVNSYQESEITDLNGSLNGNIGLR